MYYMYYSPATLCYLFYKDSIVYVYLNKKLMCTFNKNDYIIDAEPTEILEGVDMFLQDLLHDDVLVK